MPQSPTLSKWFAERIGLEDLDGLNNQEVRSRISDFYSRDNIVERIGQAGVTRASLRGDFLRGGLSSWAPIELMSEDQMAAMSRAAGKGTGFGAKIMSAVPEGIRGFAKGAFKLGAKWMGPGVTAHRMYSETKGMSTFGKLHKMGRIAGEEFMWGAGAAMGISLGGAAIKGAIGGAAGGLPGMIVGGLIGMGLGAAGAHLFNKVADTAESPVRMAAGYISHLKRSGRQGRRANLGGSLSAGNRTRAAATMRQRALQQMTRSGINARRMLGNEASMMHLR